MATKTFKVNGMSCEHCVKAVTNAVKDLPEVEKVSVNLDAGTVTVDYDGQQTTDEKIRFEIEELGYDFIA